MKNLTVALSAVAASVFLAMSANAAEIYNKTVINWIYMAK